MQKTLTLHQYKSVQNMFLPDVNSYRLSKTAVIIKDSLPLTWWTNTPNFGDLLSPYLVEKMTLKTTCLVNLKPAHLREHLSLTKHFNTPFSYFAIGSIISRANDKSAIWGSGAFGTENSTNLNKKAKYFAVRGPLTRNLLRINGIDCPEIYGDPALLIPQYYHPQIEKKYKIGIILRWSENEWNTANFDTSIKKIYLGTSDIEGTLNDILSCEKILSSSLHGIILADAYGIPSAWLSSTTPKGLEFKFYDYFISVNKVQKPHHFSFPQRIITFEDIHSQILFDAKEIEIDLKKLMDACPFLDLN